MNGAARAFYGRFGCREFAGKIGEHAFGMREISCARLYLICRRNCMKMMVFEMILFECLCVLDLSLNGMLIFIYVNQKVHVGGQDIAWNVFE